MTIDAATPLTFDIGRVISRLAGTIGRNFALLLGLAVLLVGLPGAMLAFAQLSMMSGMLSPVGPGDPFADVLAPVRVGLWVPGVLIGVVGNAALQGAVIHASVSDLSGGRASFGECLRTGFRFFLPLFCIGLIVGIGCAFGFLIFIVPGVLLGLAWTVAAPAEVVERVGIFGALERSVVLTRNHRGAISATSRVAICSVEASWKPPWLRNEVRNSFSDLLSTRNSPGT